MSEPFSPPVSILSLEGGTVDLLGWAATALSLFNTIAALWLGLTVLLNAERRAWGTWVAGGGLAFGGLIFALHSATVARPPAPVDGATAWWPIGWLPLASTPYLWYVVMAWYTGVLRTRRHRVWLAGLTVFGLALLAALVLAGLLRPYDQPVSAAAGLPAMEGGVRSLPLVVLGYAIYSPLCIVLSLSALRRPEASQRPMGEVARRRARPWLVGASGVFLAESLLLAATGAAAVRSTPQAHLAVSPPAASFLPPEILDLLLSGLLAAAVVLVGRAVVSYEIFTGKSLPRGTLFRQWRNSLLLAAGFGLLVGGLLQLPVDALYGVGLATVLMASFSALMTWRIHAERQRDMDRLRPFVASQRLYERLLEPATPRQLDVPAPFRALCGDILGARVAYLVALGPLAPLAGPPLTFPPGVAPPPPDESALSSLTQQFRFPHMMSVALDPTAYSGAVWAVPLWSERGLIGVLLLGEKADGGLYTEEEIEIARATGERLVDTQATEEMARRLMALQRQQLTESQVLDQRMRQAIHDDVLPRLHTSMLLLGAAGQNPSGGAADGASQVPATQEAVDLIAGAHRQLADLLRSLPATSAPEVARLGLIRALRQALGDDLGHYFDAVSWTAEPEAERIAEAMPTFPAEVLYCAAREAIRNAARHGRNGDPSRSLHLSVAITSGDGLEVAVEDDGVGFRPGTAPADGTGQGLALHTTLMAVIGGSLRVESVPGRHTRVVLALPRSP